MHGHAVTSLDLANFDHPDVVDRVRVIRGYVRDRWTYGTVMSDSDVSVEKAAQCLGFEPRDSSQALGVSHRIPWKHGRPGAGQVAVLIQTFKRLNV